MVEICWFCLAVVLRIDLETVLPSPSHLHGNAGLPKREVSFLQVSSVTIIFLSASDFDEMNRFLLLGFWNSPKAPKDVENIMDENSAHKVRLGIKDLNKIEFDDKITAPLTQLLKKSDLLTFWVTWPTLLGSMNLLLMRTKETAKIQEKKQAPFGHLEKNKIIWDKGEVTTSWGRSVAWLVWRIRNSIAWEQKETGVLSDTRMRWEGKAENALWTVSQIY